jgi:hypothetical protein
MESLHMVITRQLAFFAFAALCFTGCQTGRLEYNATLEESMRRLSQVLEEYAKIPVMTQGDREMVIWRDQKQVRSFYERYRDEFTIMNSVFSLTAKSDTTWSDDAALARGILYWLLTQLIPNSLTEEGALAVWGEFIQRGPTVQIEDLTKRTVGRAFVDGQTEILTPSLSYGENLEVMFRAHRILLLVKIKEYQKAIKEAELIMGKYPESKYSQRFAPDQIDQIKQLMKEG